MTQKVYLLIWFVYGILIEEFPCKTFFIKLNISENKGSGEDIVNLKSHIIREKLPINSTGLYKIISNKRDFYNYFILQSQTGVLKQRYNIDRETICKHLDICQKILLISINGQVLEVMINIEDENDNIPQFSMRHKTLYIAENSNIGSELFLPIAYDLDSEINSINRYFIKDVNSRENRKSNQYQASKYFNISVKIKNQIKVPHLKLKKEIDREEIERFELILIAEDSGQQQGSCTITISIIDVNDNSPQWPTVNISKKVKECDRQGPLLELQAFDRDDSSTANGQIKYKISDHSPKIELINQLFYIAGSSLFLSSQGLQLMENKNYVSFLITAVDGGGRENDTTVTIEIEDCNDHPPFITIDKTTVSVKENDRSPIVLTSLTVNDDDKGINSQFNCDLNDTTFFIMSKEAVYNQSNGIQLFLYSIKKISDTFFDRETLSFYSVLIRCIDLGRPPLIGEKLFSVTIIDENDNSPKFPADEIKFSITENNNIGAAIGFVTAVDPDSNENGRVTYQILNNEENFYFTITSFGKIETKWKFDREMKETYSLTIMAKDNGEPSLNDTCTVIITILDVNDCVPVFKQQYFYQITEGNGLTTINNSLGKVVAEDNDKGENGTVYYTLRQKPDINRHNNNNGFHLLKINMEGALHIYGVVDREQMVSIQAEIVAYDNGRPQLSAVANVIIDVLNINDNKPKFKYPLGKMNYINISTDTEIGQQLANFEAEDPDKGENGTINYTIMNHKNVEQNFPFELQKDGHLVLIKSLKERDDIHQLPDRLFINASDNGSPPKFESLTVNIRYIENKKDQKPNVWPTSNRKSNDKNRFSNGNENFSENNSTVYMTLLYIFVGVLFVVFIMALLFLVYTFFPGRFSKNRKLENNNIHLPMIRCLPMQHNSNYNQSLYSGETIPAQSSIFQSNSDHYNYINFSSNRPGSYEEFVLQDPRNKWYSFENVIPSNDRCNSMIRSQDNGFFYNTYSCAADINQFRLEGKDPTLPINVNSAFNKTKFNQQTLPPVLHKNSPQNEQMFTYQPKYTQRNMVVSTFV